MAEVKKMNWWYWAFIDWMVANPDCTMKDAALQFNVHVQTLYIIKNSDSFKRHFNQRVREVSGGVTEQVVDALGDIASKSAALAELTIDTLADRVATKGRDLQVNELTSIADLTLKKLGYGIEAQPSGGVTVNILSANADALARARERLEGRIPSPQKLIEVKAGNSNG